MLLHGGVELGRQVVATVRQVRLLRVLALTAGLVLLLLLLNALLSLLLSLRIQRILQYDTCTIVQVNGKVFGRIDGFVRNISL